jgi:hypothetical protein
MEIPVFNIYTHIYMYLYRYILYTFTYINNLEDIERMIYTEYKIWHDVLQHKQDVDILKSRSQSCKKISM